MSHSVAQCPCNPEWAKFFSVLLSQEFSHRVTERKCMIPMSMYVKVMSDKVATIFD